MNLLEFIKKINDCVKNNDFDSLPEKIKIDKDTYYIYKTKSTLNLAKPAIDYSTEKNSKEIDIYTGIKGTDLLADINSRYSISDFNYIEVRAVVEGKLTKNEKEYLKNIIRPFRDKIKYIRKENRERLQRDNIRIIYNEMNQSLFNSIDLPSFDAGKYFKGLKYEINYTLKDLNL